MKMGQIYKGIRAAGTAKHAKKKQLHGNASYAEAEAKKLRNVRKASLGGE
jgi:hypothetical protein